MAHIQVWKNNHSEWEFQVEIADEARLSKYRVRIDPEFYQNLETTISPHEVVRITFEYLLERENADGILKEFNVRQVSEYFEDYVATLKERLHIMAQQ